MPNIFQVPAIIENLRTLADSTVRLQVDCNELPPEQMTELFNLRKKLGWFVFKENDVKQEDVPKENAPEFANDKSPSLRLRSVLWVYWNECTNKKEPFKTFWENWVNKKIEEVKNYLPDKV